MTKEEIRQEVVKLLASDDDQRSYEIEQRLRKLDTLHTMLIREEQLVLNVQVAEAATANAASLETERKHLATYRDDIARSYCGIVVALDKIGTKLGGR